MAIFPFKGFWKMKHCLITSKGALAAKMRTLSKMNVPKATLLLLRTSLVWEHVACVGTRGRYGNARPLWEHTAGRATRGRYGNARPVRERAAGVGMAQRRLVTWSSRRRISSSWKVYLVTSLFLQTVYSLIFLYYIPSPWILNSSLWKRKRTRLFKYTGDPGSHSQCPNFSHQLSNPSHTTRGSQPMRTAPGHTVNCDYLISIVLKRSFLSVLKRAEHAIHL